MRIPATIYLLFATTISGAQDLNDSTIRRNNISEVTKIRTEITRDGNYTYQFISKETTTYNRNGRPVKSIQVTKDSQGKDSSVTIYNYRDTLLSNTEWREYKGARLVNKGTEYFEYTFDSLNRMISKKMRDLHGRKTYEEYTWSSENNIDSVHYFSNDSAVYVPERRGYDFIPGKTWQLNRVVRNVWSPDHRLERSIEGNPGCNWKYISESICYTTTDFFQRGDSSIRRIQFYNDGWQTTFSKRYSHPSGNVYEESERGDKAITFYKRNKNGLLLRTEKHEIRIEARLQETIVNYQYKFYRK